ncbi:acetylornithine deacetylase [Hoeflea sp.]|uniref:acetylornithine deacetylase n=1 Tax=Hoeflea sp. TaxID=1940281 RepID=UPI003B019EA6
METDYRSILETLVGFETTPDRSNRPLIDWIADRLDTHDMDVDVLPAEDARKANLLARIGPSAPGGIVLSGHTDVVTTKDQDWSFDPFKVSEAEGRLYGRGTADMKGFVSLVLAMAPRYSRRPLRRPIYLALSHDEETGCLGVPALIDHIIQTCEAPEFAIIGEPTSLHAVTSHKSMNLFCTRIVGKEAHSSAPDRGASAISAAAKLIVFLEDYFVDLKSKLPQDDRFDPPHCSVNIGRMDGGIATSFVANRCRVDWEFRSLPDVDADAILKDIRAYVDQELRPQLQQNHPEADIDLNCWAQIPALRNSGENALEHLIGRLTDSDERGAVSYGTEAGFYQLAGMSTVICGPGSINQAHKADEFVSIDQLEAGKTMLEKVGTWACE